MGTSLNLKQIENLDNSNTLDYKKELENTLTDYRDFYDEYKDKFNNNTENILNQIYVLGKIKKDIIGNNLLFDTPFG